MTLLMMVVADAAVVVDVFCEMEVQDGIVV